MTVDEAKGKFPLIQVTISNYFLHSIKLRCVAKSRMSNLQWRICPHHGKTSKNVATMYNSYADQIAAFPFMCK